MYNIGWLSSGKDKAARDLLKVVWEAIRQGEIPDAKILFVFCNHDDGEDKESDKFIELAEKQLGLTTIPFSSSGFERELKKENLDLWRLEYDRLVRKLINFPYQKIDIIMLVGYMLIVGEELCRRYPMINLHPAKPGGPRGTWQEVIWQLIERKEKESGAMVHLVTPELDAGPPITFCTFPIQVPYKTDELWYLWELFHEDWIKEKLFNWIREEGLKREFPLIVETLRLLASGEIKIGEGSRDLTKLINKKVKSRSAAGLFWLRF